MLREQVVGQIQTATVPVFGHVTTDVRQLHRCTQMRCVRRRSLVSDPHDVTHHQSDGAGNAEAITQEPRHPVVVRILHVHGAAFQQLERIALRNTAASRHLPKGREDVVVEMVVRIDRVQLLSERSEGASA